MIPNSFLQDRAVILKQIETWHEKHSSSFGGDCQYMAQKMEVLKEVNAFLQFFRTFDQIKRCLNENPLHQRSTFSSDVRSIVCCTIRFYNKYKSIMDESFFSVRNRNAALHYFFTQNTHLSFSERQQWLENALNVIGDPARKSYEERGLVPPGLNCL